MRDIRRAILYVRVSTDDQLNGYSPADQKERLEKYCHQKNVEIVRFYEEDESAKDFDNRPEWQKILEYLRTNKRHGIDSILFIKWDRFSRNIAEAYITLKELKRYGVEPQAIEQPLDFEVPESKIMLAVYLATPEVDNDRRALNTFHGMRRAKKEGRWMGTCLRGYKHARDEKDRKIILPQGGEEERLVKMAFDLMATGMHPIDELRRKMNKEGLDVSRAQFWALLRHKGYIGQVFLPAYKDEAAQWVKGLHEPLIDEMTFYKVQEILEGRKKPCPTKNATFKEELPLRGFLECPRCGRNLTGSASRGRLGGRFFYYHCAGGCKERRKATEVNEIFLQELLDIKIDEQATELYGNILQQEFEENNKEIKEKLSHLTKDIEKQRQRLKNARVLMLDGEIDAKEYRELKTDIENGLVRLELQESELRSSYFDYKAQIDFCVALLANIDLHYKESDGEVKQKLVGSILDKKWPYKGKDYRTLTLNPAIDLLFRRKTHDSKNQKPPKTGGLSCSVAPPGIEPGFKV